MVVEARSDKWLPALAMLAANIALGVMNSLIKKAIDEGTSCLVIITLRQLVATVFMIPIACCRERGKRPQLTVGMCTRLFLCGLFGATLTQYLFNVGMRETSATFACAFLNMTPVITFVVALIFRLERLNLRSRIGVAKVGGAAIGAVGAMVLTFYKGISLTRAGNFEHPAAPPVAAVNGGHWTIGAVALIAASMLWCSWFILQSKVNKEYPALYSCTAIIFFISFLQSAVLTLAIDGGSSFAAVKKKMSLIAILYAGSVGSGIGFLVMLWCISKRGPVFPAAFTPVIQMSAAVVDLSFVHEPLYLGSVVGSLLAILGLYCLLWGKNKEISSTTLQVEQLQEVEDIQKPKEPL